jgi:hypothetical protein
VRWWSKHDGGETRRLILEDETAIRILGGICQLRLRVKQQKVFDVRVPCEVPEKEGVRRVECSKTSVISIDDGGTYISSRGFPRANPLFWNACMASSTVHFKALIRAYRGILAGVSQEREKDS